MVFPREPRCSQCSGHGTFFENLKMFRILQSLGEGRNILIYSIMIAASNINQTKLNNCSISFCFKQQGQKAAHKSREGIS